MSVTPTYVPSSFVQQAISGFLAVDGTTATPTSAATPMPVTVVSGGSNTQIVATQYVATAAATGYAIGDILEHINEITLGSPSVIINSTWINATQSTVLASPPASGNISQLAGGVTANVSQLNGATTSTNNGTVDAGTLRVTLANNGTGVVGLSAGSNVVGGITVADGSDVAQGAKSDTAYAGSGSASIIAALKGLYNAMTAATPAGTNNIGVIQPAILAPFAATSGTAYDLSKYGSVQVNLENLAGGETWSVTGSLAVGGTKHPVANLLNQGVLNPSAASTITAAGTYTVLFGGNKELVFTSSLGSGGATSAVCTVSGAQ